MKAVLDVYLQQNSYDNKILTKEANLCQKKNENASRIQGC